VSEDEALAALVVQDAEGRNLATWEVDALEIGGSLPGPRMTARFSPARVLAECAAKRAIIEQNQSYVEAAAEREGIAFVGARCGQEVTGDVLKLFAAVYADHEDYRQEWAL